MNIAHKSFSKLFAVLCIVTAMWAQPLKTMKRIEKDENSQSAYIVGGKDQAFRIYKFLSSLGENSPFWLPAEIIRCIVIETHNLILYGIKLDCSTSSTLLATTWTLNYLYSSSISAALLKICLNNSGKSFFEIRDGQSSFTVFDWTYEPHSLESEVKTWCLIVDKKEFVEHFKKIYDPFGCCKLGYQVKTNLLHRLMWNNSNAEIMQLYCGVFLDYARRCPKKSKEILGLLNAKDDEEKTVLDHARGKKLVEIAEVIKNTKKELRFTVRREEHCLVQ